VHNNATIIVHNIEAYLMTTAPLRYVPIVDISPFLNGSDEEKKTVASIVDQTNRQIGFMVITGHGFDLELLATWFEVSKEFFEGEKTAKDEVLAPPGVQQGYHKLADSGLAAKEGIATPRDLREYFMIGQADLSSPKLSSNDALKFHRANRWPTENNVFRDVGERYYAAMEKLGAQLMKIFAVGLKLPETWFEDKIDHHFSILSSIYYPAHTTTPLPGQLRAGAHTDYGSLTILAPTDAPGGLQVRTLEGEWADVPYVQGGFIINIGDMMQRWTNGRWLSNMHRVVNPPHNNRSGPRQSIAYFLHPNHDATIECIPTCLTAGDTAIHPPILAGDYMREKETAIETGNPAA
jgi:isopenicillin N synthase-like dioxygenase